MSSVEWKYIWEVTTWDKKFSGVEKTMQPRVLKYHYYLANELTDLEQDDGDIRILYTTDRVAYTSSSYVKGNISDGEVVAIPWGGNVSVKYYKGRFVTTDNRIATSNNTDYLNNKYLYYWMVSQKDQLEKYYRGAGIKHPSMLKVLTMLIPIPSLSEQNRIVGILDTFTSSIENLKQQIAERSKQYEYYRDQLFSECSSYKKIGELTKVFSCPRVFRDQWQDSGIPFWRSSDVMSYHNKVKNPRGEAYISQSLYDELSKKSEKIEKGDILVTGGGSIGMPYLKRDDKPLFVKDADLLCIKQCDSINPSFLYHFFFSTDFRLYLKKITHDATIAHYTIGQIVDTPIPVPTLEEQQRIADILDTFEASISNLEAQLKEREKQYEYYRNKLLTFD